MNEIFRRTTLAIALLWVAAHSPTANLWAQDDKQKNVAQPKVEMLNCEVMVVDPDGNPIQDAKVKCFGLRSKISPGDWWGWDTDTYGTQKEFLTDSKGRIAVAYPKYLEEKIDTGTLDLTVNHSDFVSFRRDYSVGSLAKISLQRGFRVAATAIDDKTGNKITKDLYAMIGLQGPLKWNLKKNGILVSTVYPKMDADLRVMCIRKGKPTLFSKLIRVQPGEKSRVLLQNVPLKPGSKLTGKLDDAVQRPVKNGHVVAYIGRGTHPRKWRWTDVAPINEDGTFVFESLPGNEIVQLIPMCDGWVPAKPEADQIAPHFPEMVQRLLQQGDTGQSVPQVVKLEKPKQSTILKMKPACDLTVTVTGPDGKPLQGATVAMAPNHYWYRGGSTILGSGMSTAGYLYQLQKGTFKDTRSNPFSEKTNTEGIATIRNLPANGRGTVWVMHDKYVLPISGRGRETTADLKVGQENKLAVQLQKKGKDALGVSEEENK